MTKFDHHALRDTLGANAATLTANAGVASLVEAAVRSGAARLSADGALVVETGAFTGRSPKDKFIVVDSLTEATVWWDNSAGLAPEKFSVLLKDVIDHLAGQDLHRQDLFAGAGADGTYGVSVLTPSAWHALFIRNLLLRPDENEQLSATRNITIVHAPHFVATPVRHGTRTGTVIALDLTNNLVIIAGTLYAGEIKKSVFSLFNFHAPREGVLPMHCSANAGEDGDVALFFGLSGTGKTTLSNDPRRALIGDDEHGWNDAGVFNLEGGCYAKTIRLDPRAEPEIFEATRRFGTVLENVALDPQTRRPDFDHVALTENSRAAYPLTVLPRLAEGGRGGMPRAVVLLTADAFGVLPPIARLDLDQAVYHFLSGYTAKVAGTERGVTEPQATFSACFGAPFMPLHPSVYGELLRTRLGLSGAACWLINTGWTGGGYGVGQRIDIASTRRLLDAALGGELEGVEMRTDERFSFAVPRSVTGIDPQLLEPRRCWPNKAAYDEAADRLAVLFAQNFAKFGDASSAGGPLLQRAAQ